MSAAVPADLPGHPYVRIWVEWGPAVLMMSWCLLDLAEVMQHRLRVVVLLATDPSRVMLGCVIGGCLGCCCATRLRGRTMPAPQPVPVREPGFTVYYVRELG